MFYLYSITVELISIASYDPEATHFLLRLIPDLTPIGTIRCSELKSSSDSGSSLFKLSRLAVKSSYRKYGFGRVLVGAVNSLALNNSQSQKVEVVAHSQMHAIPFYSK